MTRRRTRVVAAAPTEADPIVRTLRFAPPLHWPALRDFLAARATPGVELVSSERYHRTLQLGGRRGVVSAGPASRTTLRVEMSESLRPVADGVLARLRALFDLDVDGAAVAAHLGRDAALAPLLRRRPGLRVPGAMEGFELAVRAVLGQQVSVRGASTLAGRLAAELGERCAGSTDGSPGAALCRYALTPARLAEASEERVAAIGLPRARAACLVSLARAAADGALPELTGACGVADPAAFVRRLVALPGIGPWTAQYVAMRAFHWADAFPRDDLGLRKAMGGATAAALERMAEAWRPWRAYAAMHLWAELADRSARAAPTTTNRGRS